MFPTEKLSLIPVLIGGIRSSECICVLQLILAIQNIDRIMGQLMNGLKQIGLHRCLNIIILADHGNVTFRNRVDL